VLSLPMHPYLDQATQDRIVTTLISIIKAHH
jgi:dTDP-4-amino-4,6-dideoxygalactose transaminase